MGSEGSLDHRERSTRLLARRLDDVCVAEERSGIAFARQPDNASIGRFGHGDRTLPVRGSEISHIWKLPTGSKPSRS
jgi:hypothetical protein